MITLFSAIMLSAVQNTPEEEQEGYGRELFEILMPASNVLVIILMGYVSVVELSGSIESTWINIKSYLYPEESQSQQEN